MQPAGGGADAHSAGGAPPTPQEPPLRLRMHTLAFQFVSK
jgi:hypothetical protein